MMMLQMMTEMIIFDAEPYINNDGQDGEETGNDEEDGCDNAIEEYWFKSPS